MNTHPFARPLAVVLAAVPLVDRLASQGGSEIANVVVERHMNLILVEAKIQGEPVTLLLDSGASGVVLESRVADRLGLEMGPVRKGGRTSQGGQFTMRFASDVAIDVGGVTAEYERVLVASCEGLARRMTGRTVHGILGHAFLSRYTCEIDYVAERMVLHDPDRFDGSDRGAAVAVSFNPGRGNLPFAEVSLASESETRSVRMLVDSGGGVGNSCGLHDADAIEALVGADAPRVAVMGSTGLADSPEETAHRRFVTRLHRLRIGPFSIPRPTVTFGTGLTGARLNLFGGEVLHRFDVVFDYARDRLLLKPNELFDREQVVDASGLFLVAGVDDAGERRVFFVSPGTPAADAGLRAGDVLRRIAGVDASRHSLAEARALFCRVGQSIEVEVARGDEVWTTVVETRSLL